MEEWKQIDDTQFYISNMGRIKNIETGRILESQLNPKGYLVTRVTINREKRNFKPHRLVAKYFIPNPENKEQVNHINGVKTDNRLENLEWCTNYENAHHAIDNNLWGNVFEASRRNNEKRAFKIKATNIETGEETIFPSINAAERACNTRHVAQVARGLRDKANGYTFAFFNGR